VDHQTPLLITLALGFVAAFALGFVATRLRLPVLVGYLVAGIAIGPFSPGLAADTGVASQLAEIGVILPMFGVGLHFPKTCSRSVGSRSLARSGRFSWRRPLVRRWPWRGDGAWRRARARRRDSPA
jgi:predicted Kef-type K+ transport protein